MRPTLKQTTMSLALALAAVSGCSGGADTGTQADKTTSSFRDGLPPTVRDGDKLSLSDSSADFPLALRSAALKLTGNYPSLADIKRIRDATDQPAEYAKIIDEYMAKPEFSRAMLKFWQYRQLAPAG